MNWKQLALEQAALMSPKAFSDIYAQTIAYSMFAARLNDKTNVAFTRIRAAQLIPQSNPFLRELFRFIADDDLDVRIKWGIDALADLFNYADMPAIHEEFRQRGYNPIIHFYENFLTAYDPSERKNRGVWYTPQPVVQFVVTWHEDVISAVRLEYQVIFAGAAGVGVLPFFCERLGRAEECECNDERDF